MSSPKNRLLLIGGGGHCSSVLDVLFETNFYDEIGIVDSEEKLGNKLLSKEYIGTDDDLNELFNEGYSSAFITVGSIGNPFLRKKLFNLIKEMGFNIPNIISKTAVVSNYAFLGNGIFIGKGSIVNVNASVGNGAIINTGSIVEHDCRIDNFVHLAPGVTLSGGVNIGENTHIGTNSTIIQEISIGKNTIIGAGSVVVKNIGDNCKAYGNPCKEVSNE
jgi:sugar O-acyltransferase (sialic acid O-acetyltransferase NeuD family)